MMAELPVKEGCDDCRTGAFGHSRDARAVALAISEVASSREEAALMTTYAAYESGNARCASGDGGLSWGAWQLRYVTREVACDPLRAARVWVARKRLAERTCVDSPAEERLAPLLSGNCDHARRQAAWRAEMAARL